MADRMSTPAATDRALIGFGEVRHTRLKPTHHAFNYPTYFLMLPLRALQRDGAGALARNRRAALSFHDSDHGDGNPDCLRWLDALLQAEGIADAQGEVWLHTYPRVFGFTFKPVSFWYCHQADGQLAAIVTRVEGDSAAVEDLADACRAWAREWEQQQDPVGEEVAS